MKFQFFIVVSVLSMLGITIFAGCSDAGSNPVVQVQTTDSPVQSQEVSFRSRVAPLFQSYGCTSCHGSSGGLSVQSVAQLLQGGDHGPAVVAGNADGSVLIRKLQANPPFGSRMPQGGPFLPDSSIQIVKLWVNQGAKNN